MFADIYHLLIYFLLGSIHLHLASNYITVLIYAFLAFKNHLLYPLTETVSHIQFWKYKYGIFTQYGNKSIKYLHWHCALRNLSAMVLTYFILELLLPISGDNQELIVS